MGLLILSKPYKMSTFKALVQLSHQIICAELSLIILLISTRFVIVVVSVLILEMFILPFSPVSPATGLSVGLIFSNNCFYWFSVFSFTDFCSFIMFFLLLALGFFCSFFQVRWTLTLLIHNIFYFFLWKNLY